MSVRLNVKNHVTDYGTVVNFGRGTVAMHESLRHDNMGEAAGYLVFTTQEFHEVGIGRSNINYNSIEEMEAGGQLHFVFDNIRCLEALQSILEKLHTRMENDKECPR